MNVITIIQRDGRPEFDILVDARRLAEHFVGRLGAHPSLVVSIGWVGSEAEQGAIEELLAVRKSALESGRVAVLVCEQCGDIGCGALAVRIERRDDIVRWTDWAYENGSEPARPVAWPTYPETFEFDRVAYERALSAARSGSSSHANAHHGLRSRVQDRDTR